jgi:outer membrane protein/protease secretion system outer membrane protein
MAGFVPKMKKRALMIALLACLPFKQAAAINLLDSYRLALDKDPTWLMAKAQADVERAALPMAIAQMLPNISAGGSSFKNDLTQSYHAVGRYIQQKGYYSSNANLTLRQPLFRPYIFFNYQQASATVEAAEAVLAQGEQDMAVRVSSAYFEALMAQDQLAFVTAQVDAYSGQVKMSTKSFEAGLGTRTDIDEAQSRLDLAVAQQLEAEQNTRTTRHQLEALINEQVKELSPLLPQQLLLELPEPNVLETWLDMAEVSNATLSSLKAQVEAAGREVAKTRSGHLPTVDFVLQRTLGDSDNPYSGNTNMGYSNNQVGLQVNLPIFSGGYTSAQTSQAIADQERQRMRLDAARSEIAVKVRKEFQGVSEGILKIKAYEQAEKSSRQLVISSEKGILAGTRSSIDLLNAQQQLMNARRDLAQARYAYILSKLRLLSLVNGVTEETLIRVNNHLQQQAPSDA